tara:strand:- start:4346 stop:5113 length:768 start_codon:yes stop_codon:yes gene_type:complete
MNSFRLIPVLLLSEGGLVKSTKFKNYNYIGDPINAVKIFNEKEVDELVFIDIMASKINSAPNFDLLEQIASECFMPLGYGGGINNLDDIKRILSIGFEKIILNTSIHLNPDLLKIASKEIGSQSVVVCIDYKTNIFGNRKLFSHSGINLCNKPVIDFAKYVEELGAGEIILQSVDNDGKMSGYDLSFIKQFNDAVNIPVVACGGAGSLTDFSDALKHTGVSGIAAGSKFIYHGTNKGVLINYPSNEEVKKIFIND